MLTRDDHRRVKANWADVATLTDQLARIFYANLFQLDPSTKALFSGDIDAQGAKLVATLGFIVDAIDRPEELAASAEDLAKRHVGYGVTADQYKPVGEALILSLHHLLGPTFDTGDETAWRNLYGAISKVMIDAAYSGEA